MNSYKMAVHRGSFEAVQTRGVHRRTERRQGGQGGGRVTVERVRHSGACDVLAPS